MAELIEIKRVLIGPENMTASVRLADDAPIMTSEDLEGTTYVYRLLPHIVEHKVEDAEGGIFRDVMGSTNLADLLAHVTIELLGQTRLLEEPPAVHTQANGGRGRAYKIEIACPDDVLVVTALSCGAWIMDWAYRGADDPDPDIDAIVAGLVQLVENVGDEGEDLVVDYDAPKPPEEPSEPEDEQDEAAAVDELDEEALGSEEGAGYAGQIDFSKQYVFGKQRSFEEDADTEEVPVDAQEAAADEEADAEQDAPVEEEPAQKPEQLWTEAPDLSERVAISERAAVLEAEINRLMEAVQADSSASRRAMTETAPASATQADEPVAQAADTEASASAEPAEDGGEVAAEVDKPTASGTPEEPVAQTADAEAPAPEVPSLSDDDARIEAEIDRLMASIEALRDALNKSAR